MAPFRVQGIPSAVRAPRASKIAFAAVLGIVGCGASQVPGGSAATPHPRATARAPASSGSSAPGPNAPPAPRKRDDRFAVATENTAAAQAAVRVFRAGGNAIDAAVAGVFVAGVTQPASTGIGG